MVNRCAHIWLRSTPPPHLTPPPTSLPHLSEESQTQGTPEVGSLRGEHYHATENPSSSAKVAKLNTDRKGLGQELSEQPWGEGKLTYLQALLGLACTLASRTRPPLSLHPFPNSLPSEWSRDNGVPQCGPWLPRFFSPKVPDFPMPVKPQGQTLHQSSQWSVTAPPTHTHTAPHPHGLKLFLITDQELLSPGFIESLRPRKAASC